MPDVNSLAPSCATNTLDALQVMKASPSVGSEEMPLKFRKISDLRKRQEAEKREVASRGDTRRADIRHGSKEANKEKVGGSSRGRRVRGNWINQGLSLVTEAQRTSTIQLSGIGVTSASVQGGFDEVQRGIAKKAKADEARAKKEAKMNERERPKARVLTRSTKPRGKRSSRRGRYAGGDGVQSDRHVFLHDLEEFVQSYKRVVYP